MHLHDRLVTTGLFDDVQFCRQVPPAARLFYVGLIQLADDAGDVLDDCWEYKSKLYSVDFDVTIEDLTRWRDLLVNTGRLVPYRAGGKDCLHLRNFRKHQAKRYWSAPEVPLPPWVVFTPTPKAPYRGTYSVDEGLLDGARQDQDGARQDQHHDDSGLSRPPSDHKEHDPGREVVSKDPWDSDSEREDRKGERDTSSYDDDATGPAPAVAAAPPAAESPPVSGETPDAGTGHPEPPGEGDADADVRQFCDIMGLHAAADANAAKAFGFIRGCRKSYGADLLAEALIVLRNKQDSDSPCRDVAHARSYLTSRLHALSAVRLANTARVSRAREPPAGQFIPDADETARRRALADAKPPPPPKGADADAAAALEPGPGAGRARGDAARPGRAVAARLAPP